MKMTRQIYSLAQRATVCKMDNQRPVRWLQGEGHQEKKFMLCCSVAGAIKVA